jgi:phosphomannomutase
MKPNYQMETPKSLFRTSGVRGVVNKDLATHILHDLGRSRPIGTQPTIRISSESANEVKKTQELLDKAHSVITGLMAGKT